jgi:hypothetical protein
MNHVGIVQNHPWLGMVLIPAIYGDDWGMVYGIVLPTWKNHPGWGLNIYPVGPGIKLWFIRADKPDASVV